MSDCCSPKVTSCCSSGAAPGAATTPCEHFAQMIPRCLEYAKQADESGRPVVAIMCEYTPRELIMAAGGVPVCLCGGAAETIPDAEKHLPSNLCPLIKSTFGYNVQKSNPFLEMADLIVAETTCDGKKKMFELLSESHDMYVLELPQRSDDPAALDYWTEQLRRFRRFLEERYEKKITDESIREAIQTMNRERTLRSDLAALMDVDRPPLTGRQLLSLKSTISGLETDFEQYEKALEMMREKPVCKKEAPPVRVLMTGVPMPHGAERVLEIIEQSGAVVVVQENCTGIKPIHEQVNAKADDPIRALAEKYYHLPCSVMTPNPQRLERLEELNATYRPDCVIDLVWQACLTYDVESQLVKRFVEEELKLPYMKIETDYSPNDSARIAMRVEALCETIQASRLEETVPNFSVFLYPPKPDNEATASFPGNRG